MEQLQFFEAEQAVSSALAAAQAAPVTTSIEEHKKPPNFGKRCFLFKNKVDDDH